MEQKPDQENTMQTNVDAQAEGPQQLAQQPEKQPTNQPVTKTTNKSRKILIILATFLLAIVLLGGIWYLFYAGSTKNAPTTTTYFSPEPTVTPSATPSDLTEEEASVEASLKLLDSDQESIDQSLQDQPDNFESL
jgi:hypothetical protein